MAWPNDVFDGSLKGDTFLSSYPQADIGALLDCTVKGKSISAPRLPLLPIPKVQLVSHGAYHGRGLFPCEVNDVHFLTPSVFSSTRWVKRRLTPLERLLVYDCPTSLTNNLNESTLERLALLLPTPLKCFHAVVDAFPRAFSGGGMVVSPSTSTLPSKIQIAPTGWLDNVEHKRKEGASRSDDAEVNLMLWMKNLELVLDRKLGVRDAEALDRIRMWVVDSLWKRSVTKCFCNWLRCKICHKKNFIDKLFNEAEDKKEKTVDTCKIKHVFSKNVEVVWRCCDFEYMHKNKRKQGKGRYVWKDKRRYKRWWKTFHRGSDESDGVTSKEHILNVDAGVDCIRRATGASTWTWDKGSRPFFWRWGEFSTSARDGAKVFIEKELPRCTTRQTKSKNDSMNQIMKTKLKNVRDKGYIAPGHVQSVTSFFGVEKDKVDIRMVYNGTSSGLNEAVWAPWFCLPTVENHLRAVQPGTHMIDIDLTEMFLNFMLDVKIRTVAGVDLTKIFVEELTEDRKILWERWERLLMGFKPSPYLTTRELHRFHEFLCGHRNNPTNVFRWDRVVFNLPGSTEYVSNMPKVYRVRKDGTMAGDLFKYMDDLRCTAPSQLEAWAGARQICCRLAWLGLQDAPRKRSDASVTPRAWAGSIIHADKDTVTVLVSQEKWLKTKTWLKWIHTELKCSNGIEHKSLERCIGFLIYVSRTYKAMVPFLKGFHKTLDGWRGGRDEDGWKYYSNLRHDIEDDLAPKWEGNENVGDKDDPYSLSVAPVYVTPVPRLEGDVNAMMNLTETEAPPKVTRRRKQAATICYGVLDASGKGFGYALEIEGIVYSEYGQWSVELESEHSNYKELKNLVNAVENACAHGRLQETEVYLFTDNFTAECAYYRGGSNTSKKLNGLIFRLWSAQMQFNFDLFVYHIAGTRMITSGIDGLSRGDKSEGIAKGESILRHIPIQLSPTQRSADLKSWLEESVWDDKMGKLIWLTPEDWFENLLKEGNFVWDVPPSAGDVAVEQLCSHTHGRPEAMHMFLIPRLCTSHWRKQLLKCCDLVITLPFDNRFWPHSAHEPLLLGIHFPLLPPLYKFRPWKLKRTKFVENFEVRLRRVCTTSDQVDWNILREFLLSARSIPSLSECMARKLLQAKSWGQVPTR
jgi:hypothetical protein